MKHLLLNILLAVAAADAVAQDFTAAPPLPEFPRFYQTTEYDIRIDLVAGGLANPWSIAISGLSFYDGDVLPRWQGNAFVGAMIMGRTPMTGHIQRITFSDEGVPLAREPILVDLRQRIRDVRPGPDGNIYVLTDQNPGAVLRISPPASQN